MAKQQRPQRPNSSKGISGQKSKNEPGTKSRVLQPKKAGKPFAESKAGKKPQEKKDHTGGWRSESDLSGGQKRKSGGTQFRKMEGKTWKGKPVVEVRHTMRLNKYIANSGICSRREADKLIEQGMIEVNGTQITEMGYQVQPTDKVTYAGERITPEKPVYILLNKPKDYITTSKDPQERKTVMMLLRRVGDVRLFPVGRLDRNTTGLLLLTNDGHLAKKLMHPSHGVKKLYHVHLDRNLRLEHFQAILEGVELEDGPMKADQLAYVDGGKDKKQVGIEIHSGRNRIVRRLFEHLGYRVLKLDRVSFAGLTKKDLPRGKWRHLNAQELNNLRML